MRLTAGQLFFVLTALTALSLAACGGNTALVPSALSSTSPIAATPIAIPSSALAAPTPVAPYQPSVAPTPTVSSSPVTGLPSAAPST